MRTAVLLVAVLSVARATGGEAVINGADKPVPTGGFATLSVKTEDGDVVGWQVYPSPITRNSSGGQLDVSRPAAGNKVTVMVTVVNFASKKFDQGTKEVTFDDPAPPAPPTPPDPNPNPNPDPDPMGTTVDKTLLGKLQTAYNQEDAESKALLDELDQVFSTGIVAVKKAATWGGLFAAMDQTAQQNGVAGKLQKIQTVTAAELKAALPWQGAGDQVIDAAGRAKAKAEFQKIRTALARVK